jgi:hypothetical protein
MQGKITCHMLCHLCHNHGVITYSESLIHSLFQHYGSQTLNTQYPENLITQLNTQQCLLSPFTIKYHYVFLILSLYQHGFVFPLKCLVLSPMNLSVCLRLMSLFLSISVYINHYVCLCLFPPHASWNNTFYIILFSQSLTPRAKLLTKYLHTLPPFHSHSTSLLPLLEPCM